MAEGVRLVGDALDAGASFRFVLVRDDPDSHERAAALLGRLATAGIRVGAVEPSLFDGAAATETPQGILAVIETPRLPLPGFPSDLAFSDHVISTSSHATTQQTADSLLRESVEGVASPDDRGAAVEPPWLILDGVQDPGNLGTALRSAAAAGAGAVLVTPGTVDPRTPKRCGREWAPTSGCRFVRWIGMSSPIC